MKKPTYDKPSEVVADEGKVRVDGPDSVDVALTPEAALETGGRLIDAAGVAAGQERNYRRDEGMEEEETIPPGAQPPGIVPGRR